MHAEHADVVVRLNRSGSHRLVDRCYVVITGSSPVMTGRNGGAT